MRSYVHFTLEERESLRILYEQGCSIRAIARKLSRSPSSISREIRRNRHKRKGTYNAWGATSLYLKRRKKCVRRSRILGDEQLLCFVREKLASYWSPEIITAIWKQEHPGARLSHSTIYRALYKGWLAERTAGHHLFRRNKRRYKERSKYNTITPQRTIRERTPYATKRKRVGDWEGDCIVSGNHGKSCLFTCVDRASRLLLAARSDGQNAKSVHDVMIRVLKNQPAYTLTLDNGSEFAKHRELEKILNIRVYFADPRSPWQRGSNEQINGLLRFFFPKSTDFSNVDDTAIQFAVDCLNNRPRKCLGWLSPQQVFLSKCCT